MFRKDILKLDSSVEVDHVTEALREQVLGRLHRATRYLHKHPLLASPFPEV